MSETNHGPMPGGGFWAAFCSNESCNILGCPGDCAGPEAPPAEPEAPVCRWCGQQLSLGRGGMFRGLDEKSICLGTSAPPDSMFHEPRSLPT